MSYCGRHGNFHQFSVDKALMEVGERRKSVGGRSETVTLSFTEHFPPNLLSRVKKIANESVLAK